VCSSCPSVPDRFDRVLNRSVPPLLTVEGDSDVAMAMMGRDLWWVAASIIACAVSNPRVRRSGANRQHGRPSCSTFHLTGPPFVLLPCPQGCVITGKRFGGVFNPLQARVVDPVGHGSGLEVSSDHDSPRLYRPYWAVSMLGTHSDYASMIFVGADRLGVVSGEIPTDLAIPDRGGSVTIAAAAAIFFFFFFFCFFNFFFFFFSLGGGQGKRQLGLDGSQSSQGSSPPQGPELTARENACRIAISC